MPVEAGLRLSFSFFGFYFCPTKFVKNCSNKSWVVFFKFLIKHDSITVLLSTIKTVDGFGQEAKKLN